MFEYDGKSEPKPCFFLILFFAPKQAQGPTLATLKLKTEVYTFGKIQTT